MQTDILYRPSYSLAVVKLAPNETIRVEGGAMVSMSAGVTLETKATGGILKSLARTVLAGETFFMNTFHAPANGGEVTLAPALPGDLMVRPLQNESFMVQSGAYLASDETVNVDTKWGGARAFFGTDQLIMLRCSGTGTLIFASYGAIHEKDLAAGERYVVDTGHLVAFTEGIGFKVQAIGGIKSTLLSGEGLVVELTGPGTLFLQTRSQRAFLSWLIPLLPKPEAR